MIKFARYNADSRSLKTALSVFSCSRVRLSSNVNIFCGGSLIAKRGLRLGRTVEANCAGDKVLEIRKTLGRIEGKRCVSFI